jgi:copper chaperone CopZ
MHNKMKTIKLLVAMVVMVAAFALNANAQNKKEKVKKEAEVTFVVDLHCADCQKKVEAALPYVKGVKDMKVTLEGGTIWLKYDPNKTSKQVLANELLKMGYAATEKKTQEQK